MLNRTPNCGVRKTSRFTNITTQNVVFPDAPQQKGASAGEGPLRGRGVLWAERASGNSVIFTDRDGVNHTLSGETTAINVKDEGVSLGSFGTLDLIGSQITASVIPPSQDAKMTVVAPDIFTILSTGDDAGGLDITNLGELNFTTGIQIGTDVATASANNSIAIGQNSAAGTGDVVVLGTNATNSATGDSFSNVAVGYGAIISGSNVTDSVAIGTSTNVKNRTSVVVGTGNFTAGTAFAYDGVIFGRPFAAGVDRGFGTAIGARTRTHDRVCIAIGYKSAAINGNVCIGGITPSRFNGGAGSLNINGYIGGAGNSLVIGGSSPLGGGEQVLSIGVGAVAASQGSIAIGRSAIGGGGGSITIGSGATAVGTTKSNAAVFGQNVDSKATGGSMTSLDHHSLMFPGAILVRGTLSLSTTASSDLITIPINTGEHVVLDAWVVVVPQAGDDVGKSRAWVFRDFFVQNEAGVTVLTAGTTINKDPDAFVNGDSASITVSGALVAVTIQGAVQAVARTWTAVVMVSTTSLT